MESHMRWYAVLAGAAMVFAQPPAPLAPEVIQLARIRDRMLMNLAHQPNYTCVETIERSQRSGPTRKFALLDTLRLEVALVDGKEMFAWPGEKKFEDTEREFRAARQGDFLRRKRDVRFSRTRRNRPALRFSRSLDAQRL
jgi:hypothetical protein